MDKRPLFILSGPTAVGKTSLSVQLAKRINAEIISADSMQVYRKMDIGSAKIRSGETEGIKHYLIDVLDATEPFDVVTFQKMAKEAMEEIYAKGKIPLIVGGTGFYIQSVCYDIDFGEKSTSSAYEDELYTLYRNKGARVLHEMLQKVDPKSALLIHENNVVRVIRALCFYNDTKERISDHNLKQRQKESPYALLYYVLCMNRQDMYERINLRVDDMLKEGLLEEVKMLKDEGLNQDMTAANGLGYKELLAYLDGEYDLEKAVYLIKQNTRHFAKRQMTWFRREKEVRFLDKDFLTEEQILEKIMEEARNEGIIQ